MTKFRTLSRIVAPIFLICIVSLPLFAQDAREPIGHMSAAFGTVSWRSNVAADSYHLTVGFPDGTRIEKDFRDGKMLTLRTDDLGGRPDGTYTYELRTTPRVSASLRAALDAARERNDDATIERLTRENGLTPIVQSGTFGVSNGAIITSEATEDGGKRLSKTANATSSKTLNPVANDQVIADDLIVQGSTCVGLDCVVNESFGFDTLRLKENSTRIKFDDTSTSAGFPNNDWQLTANDSASGGANKFSIDDITNSKTPFTVTAAAPTNSIFVASSGKVGFGNNNPGLNLHVTATDTPAVRLEQTNGGGFTAQTWDVAGNEANFFVRDLTGGSRLPFRIRPGAPTSSIDIAASGGIGFGTASPRTGYGADFLQTTSMNGVRFFLNFDATHNPGLEFGTVVTGSPTRVLSFDRAQGTWIDFLIEHKTGGTGTTFAANGNIGLPGVTAPTNPIQASSGAFLSSGGTWTNSSSRALKFDICDVEAGEAMEALKELNPVHFTYKVDPKEKHVGFIAEDVPSLVATPDRKSLSPMDIVAVLTKVVKEQQKTIEDLQARIDKIEKQN